MQFSKVERKINHEYLLGEKIGKILGRITTITGVLGGLWFILEKLSN